MEDESTCEIISDTSEMDSHEGMVEGSSNVGDTDMGTLMEVFGDRVGKPDSNRGAGGRLGCRVAPTPRAHDRRGKRVYDDKALLFININIKRVSAE